jgi:hypothetical protein
MGGFILFMAAAGAFLLINLSRIYLIGKIIKNPKGTIRDVSQGENSSTLNTALLFAELPFLTAGMYMMILALFKVGHGERLYQAELPEDRGSTITLLFMGCAFVFAAVLFVTKNKECEKKFFVAQGLFSWLIGVFITVVIVLFNIGIQQHPERFHGFDEYTLHEMLTKCIPCSLIGSLILVTALMALHIFIQNIRFYSKY